MKPVADRRASTCVKQQLHVRDKCLSDALTQTRKICLEGTCLEAANCIETNAGAVPMRHLAITQCSDGSSGLEVVGESRQLLREPAAHALVYMIPLRTQPMPASIASIPGNAQINRNGGPPGPPKCSTIPKPSRTQTISVMEIMLMVSTFGSIT